MSLTIDKRIARARVEQINRVNGKVTFEQLAEQRALVERLQKLLQSEREARLDAERERDEARALLASSGRHLVNGRPVLTVQEAAARAGVSIYTVYRYLKSGHWQGADAPTCCVYADQPLAKKRKP